MLLREHAERRQQVQDRKYLMQRTKSSVAAVPSASNKQRHRDLHKRDSRAPVHSQPRASSTRVAKGAATTKHQAIEKLLAKKTQIKEASELRANRVQSSPVQGRQPAPQRLGFGISRACWTTPHHYPTKMITTCPIATATASQPVQEALFDHIAQVTLPREAYQLAERSVLPPTPP
eukprot:jgi/Chlat1/6415/Chrsp45S05922